jgi:DNA-binding NtrC family response regulator
VRSPSECNLNAILLLDDEFDVTFSFKQILEDKGFHVFGFTDPVVALNHFQMNSEQYRLVISDIRMPVINGYQFIKKIKGHKTARKSVPYDSF